MKSIAGECLYFLLFPCSTSILFRLLSALLIRVNRAVDLPFSASSTDPLGGLPSFSKNSLISLFQT